MPEQFDPAWEYWVPSPEMQEAFGDADAPRSFAGLTDARLGRGAGRHHNMGVRFGRGDPDRPHLKLGRAKRTRESDLTPIPCRGCGHYFLPDRRSRKHCSGACYRPPGRAKTYDPAPVPCPACRTPFAPRRPGQRYCSSRCGGGAGRDPVGVWVPQPPGGRACPWCAAPVTPGTRGSPKLFCSRRCKLAFANCVLRAKKVRPMTATLTLDAAKDQIRVGARFGDVYPQLANPDRDGDELKRFFCRDCKPRANRELGFAPDQCPTCSGYRMVRTGSCLTCTECSATSGCG